VFLSAEKGGANDRGESCRMRVVGKEIRREVG
jgi:hypothetical protein